MLLNKSEVPGGRQFLNQNFVLWVVGVSSKDYYGPVSFLTEVSFLMVMFPPKHSSVFSVGPGINNV